MCASGFPSGNSEWIFLTREGNQAASLRGSWPDLGALGRPFSGRAWGPWAASCTPAQGPLSEGGTRPQGPQASLRRPPPSTPPPGPGAPPTPTLPSLHPCGPHPPVPLVPARCLRPLRVKPYLRGVTEWGPWAPHRLLLPGLRDQRRSWRADPTPSRWVVLGLGVPARFLSVAQMSRPSVTSGGQLGGCSQ